MEYESILVAFEDNDYSPEAVQTAVRLAVQRRRGIHVLVTITVPPNSPIDASMPKRRQGGVGDRLGGAARRAAGGDRALGEGPAGQAGRRIVEEAREIRAKAIVMALPPTAHRRDDIRAYA